jgi:hypothetical protein
VECESKDIGVPCPKSSQVNPNTPELKLRIFLPAISLTGRVVLVKEVCELLEYMNPMSSGLQVKTALQLSARVSVLIGLKSISISDPSLQSR